MVKVPDPVYPEPPANFQVPEIVFPCAVPESVRVLVDGDVDCTVIPKEPFTWPLKLPLKVNDPVSVPPEEKHDESVMNLKFEIVKEPSPFTESDVPNAKAVLLPLLSRVAFQVPLTLAGFVSLDPHPTRASPTTSKTVTANCFISKSPGV